jgi:hypothetical protein
LHYGALELKYKERFRVHRSGFRGSKTQRLRSSEFPKFKIYHKTTMNPNHRIFEHLKKEK